MGGGGYPIQQYRNKNWQIPKYRVDRRNTDTAFMIGTTIEKDALPISSQINCQKLCNHLPLVKSLKNTDVHQTGERNEHYRNIVKDLLLPNNVSQKDGKPHTTGLNDTAILRFKIKITEIPLEKKLNTVISRYVTLPWQQNFWMTTN